MLSTLFALKLPSAACAASLFIDSRSALLRSPAHVAASIRAGRVGPLANLSLNLHHRIRTCSTHAITMTGGPTATEASKPVEEYRLPTDVKPKHYDITIRTDLEKSKFDGFVIAQYVLSLSALSPLGPDA